MNWTTIQRRLGVILDNNPGTITFKALLDRLCGHDTDPAFAQTLAFHAAGYGLTTPARLAEFLAEVVWESGGLTHLRENLNYTSAERIRAVFPTHFPTLASAQACVRNPVALANTVYAGRMGNDAPGDGWRFAGKGAIQLTGKANYALYGPMIGVDLLTDPEKAVEPSTAMNLALAYWNKNGLNALADASDWTGCRKKVNGGKNGLVDVASIRAKALAILA
jgi:putative chitinase